MTKARDIADLGSNDVLNTTASGVDVTGTLVADGVTVSNSAPILTITDTDGPYTSKVSSVGSNMELHAVSGNMRFRTGSGAIENMRIAPSGDITMYKDDGSTAGMTFDASAGDITVAGAVKSSKLTSSRDASAVFVDFVDTGVANDTEGDVVIQGYYPIKFKTDIANERMRIHRNGDITFFKYNSADAGFFYDSSTQNVSLTDGGVFLDYSNLDMRRDSHISGDKRSTFWLNGSGGYPGNNYFQLGTYGGGLGAIERIRVYGNNNTNTGDVIRINSGDDVVINENGYAETDFRVESDTNTHAFFLNASANRIGLFESNPQQGVSLGGGNIFEYRTASQAMFRPSGNDNDHRIVSLTNLGMDVVWGGATTTSMQRWRNGQEVVFNEDSVDQDFRVESDNMTHALFVNGYDGKVGVFNAGPRSTLEVGSTSAKHGIQLNGGPNGVATQIHMIDGRGGSFTTLTIDVQLGGAGGYFYQVQVAGTGGCRFQTGGGYTNGTNNFSHSLATGSGFTVTSPSSNLIRLVCTSGVGVHPGCEIKMTHALNADHDQDNVTITWS